MPINSARVGRSDARRGGRYPRMDTTRIHRRPSLKPDGCSQHIASGLHSTAVKYDVARRVQAWQCTGCGKLERSYRQLQARSRELIWR